MNKWISVRNKLPEDKKLVLLYVYNPYGENDLFIGYRQRRKLSDGTYSRYEWVAQHPLSCGGVVIREHGNLYLKPRIVTHWMLLPEPPQSA